MLLISPAGLRPRLERRLASAVAREVRDARLTYLSLRNLRTIERCVRSIRRARTPGIFLEAGVALGGSGIVITRLMPQDREFHGYDVFGMIPPPGEKDGEKPHQRYEAIASGRSGGIGGDPYYGYEEDLYEKVTATFASYGVQVDGERVSLHKGLFEDTLDLSGRRVAFAHLDCDWYDPVKLCLERIHPALSRGGFVISDDYNNYDGAARAVDEFLATHPDMRRLPYRRPPERTTSLVLQRM